MTTLLELAAKALAEQRASDARAGGCSTFHSHTQRNVKQGTALELDKLWHAYQERISIMHYDGHADLREAERQAFLDVVGSVLNR